MNVNNIIKLINYNVSEIISEDELKILLLSDKKINIKIGFDPTASNLHLGHLVLLLKLKELQKLGFEVNIVIGDFTARIGDPSGKNKTRSVLILEEIIANYKTYKDQIFKILSKESTNIFFNSNWLDSLTLKDLLNILNVTTISRMLERSDFKIRFKSGISIGFQEFLYPILQSYDSLYLNSNIEIGGIDQKFNFLLARDMQKKFNKLPQVIIMMPILRGTDGINKMSKSMNNCINMNDDSYNIFCKVMSIPDSLIVEYFSLLGIKKYNEVSINFLNCDNPKNLKIELATSIVTMIYNESISNFCKKKFINIFFKKNIVFDIPVVNILIKKKEIFLYDLLKKMDLNISNSDIRRLIKFNAIEINNIIINDKKFLVNINGNCYIKIGKKKFFKINFKYYNK